jgi:hypothetical protein
MHYLTSVYSVTIPLLVSGWLVTHHQEVTTYVCKKNETRYNQMIVATVDVLTSFDVVTNDNR